MKSAITHQMEIAHIIEELSYDTGDLPRDAIESAVARRNEVIPHLLNILENSINQIDEIIAQDNYQGHLYAIYLLAQFREKRAFPLILKLISFPGEIPHAIAGDLLTEDLGRIFASVCDKIAPLQKIIENEMANEYVRAASLSALVTLVGAQMWEREEIVSYFKLLFQKKLKRTPSFIWDHLVLSSIELYPSELYNEIKISFDEKLINEKIVLFKDVENALLQPKEAALHSLFQKTELIEDVVTEMEKWLSHMY